MSTRGQSLGVAMVAACPFPANHGSPASIREMSEALAHRGHRVHVITYPMQQPIPVQGVQIHRVGHFLRSRPITVGPTFYKPLLDFLMIFTLVRCINREGLDLIHAHNYEGALIGSVAKHLTGRPLLYNAVNTMGDELPSYGLIRPRALAVGLARLLDTYVPRSADHVTVVSEELRAFVGARGVPPERIKLMPPGVNPEMFDGADPTALRRQLQLGDAPIVMYTGTLDQFQRVDYLIRAMAQVAAHIPAARLVLCANIAKAEDTSRLLGQARELGIAERVLVIPHTTLADLPTFLAAADVTVCTRPACPGFPVKLLNYMAMRKAIVTFHGSAKGLCHLENAYVVKDHDWEGLARGITTLLTDRAMAQRLGERARAAIAGTFDWPSLAEQIEGVYRRMLTGSASVREPTGVSTLK